MFIPFAVTRISGESGDLVACVQDGWFFPRTCEHLYLHTRTCACVYNNDNDDARTLLRSAFMGNFRSRTYGVVQVRGRQVGDWRVWKTLNHRPLLGRYIRVFYTCAVQNITYRYLHIIHLSERLCESSTYCVYTGKILRWFVMYFDVCENWRKKKTITLNARACTHVCDAATRLKYFHITGVYKKYYASAYVLITYTSWCLWTGDRP